MANPLRALARRAGVMVRAAGRMLFQGYGGQGLGWRALLPGAQFDYELAAGDLWRNSAVASCLRWLRTNFPEPRLEVVRTLKDGSEEVVVGHDLPLLLRRPNPFYDWFTLCAVIVLSAVVDGNVYLRKVRSDSGKVVELWWIPHWLVTPRWKTDGTEFIGWYDYEVNGRLERIPLSEVIHFKTGCDPRDDRKGFSELKTALRSVVGLNECDGYTASILRNMGVPSVIVSPAGDVTVTPDDIEIFKQQWRENYTGEQRGDPLVGTRAFKVEKLTFTPEEMRLDKIPLRLEDQVCAVIGLPAMVVGLTSGAAHKTYANYGEARKAAYEDCLIPLQKALAECLTWQLLKEDFADGDRVRFDYAGVQCLAENESEVAERVGKAYSVYRGIKRSEYREALGYDWDAGDEVYFDEASPAPALPAPDPAPADDDDQGERTRSGALRADLVRSKLWDKINGVLTSIEEALESRGRGPGDDRGPAGAPDRGPARGA